VADWLATWWPLVTTVLAVLLALWTAGHAVLHRRDARAALLWVGLVALAPFLGAALYWLFGVNRLQRRARILRAGLAHVRRTPDAARITPAALAAVLPPATRHLAGLEALLGRVVRRPLVAGNRIEPLIDGDEAYPAMLDAIDAAERAIAFSTYIFDRDKVGERFAERLGAAVDRGVRVRVLLDDAGTHYSFPRITGLLDRRGVPYALFNRRFRFLPTSVLNLRLHRKTCVVDGRVGFIGGINVREGHLLAERPDHPLHDVHFRVEGPVVAHLTEVFAEDWAFTTGEALADDPWFPVLGPVGGAYARAVVDGPDEDFERLRYTILGGLALARERVRIVTPYFLPDADILAALSVTALRGVLVDLVIPERNNIRLVEWATRAILWQVLQHGVRVWATPPPFDHTKLMLVDDHWSLFGSGNWDARSLRLNFEVNVASFDGALARRLDAIVEDKVGRARAVTQDEVDGRTLPARLRDGVARLFTPVL
jgi:cardiolipin synthase